MWICYLFWHVPFEIWITICTVWTSMSRGTNYSISIQNEIVFFVVLSDTIAMAKRIWTICYIQWEKTNTNVTDLDSKMWPQFNDKISWWKQNCFNVNTQPSRLQSAIPLNSAVNANQKRKKWRYGQIDQAFNFHVTYWKYALI